jgi:hypothetical protein
MAQISASKVIIVPGSRPQDHSDHSSGLQVTVTLVPASRESLVSDIPAGDISNLFYSVKMSLDHRIFQVIADH